MNNNDVKGGLELSDEQKEKLENGETVKIEKPNRTYKFEATE